VTELLAGLSSAYRAMATVAQARVVVDSSMSPTYGKLLLAAPDLDVKSLHLVRDPRAVVNAWSRPTMQDADQGVPMRRYSTMGGSARWVVENALMRHLLSPPTFTVRYEEFVADPKEVVKRVWRQLDLPPSDGNFTGTTTLVLDPSHTVWGNPSRFANGLTEIRDDRRWMQEMSATRQRLVSIATRSGMRRYGYSPSSHAEAKS
jgi:hypothetical protein